MNKQRIFILFIMLMTFGLTSVIHAQQASGEILDVWVEHNETVNGQSGMRIHVAFETHNMRGAEGRIVAYFYFRSGTALRDFNDRFRDSDGNVSVGDNFQPRYADTLFSDFTLFMPYDELHMDDGEYDLMMRVSGFHQLSSGYTQFARSDPYYFEFSKGPSWENVADNGGDFGRHELEAGFMNDPYSVRLTAEGYLAAYEIFSGCSGYITGNPDFTLDWEGRSSMLRFYVNGLGEDSVLVISDPYDRITCNDDYRSGTLDAGITFNNPAEGRYDIWVGTLHEDESFSATLYITELSSMHP